MPDPLSVYVPLESLTKQTIESVALTALKHEMPDWNHSRRTLLAFLLAINERLNEIEKNKIQYDEQTLKHAIKVRQWLVREEKSGQIIEFDWNELRKTYDNMINNKNNKKEMYLGMRNEEPYYELTINAEHSDIDQSRKYMARFRNNGWEPHELKVYWNVEQLEIMCPKDGQEVENERLPPHDPSDDDVVQALRQYPVSKRNHAGTITYINKGIEKAVFDVPKDAQIILLNFANECSPGGGYLWHACAQEEIILYNSDGYRALLDLKYGRMGGGYAIPEFGLAYVRDICFVDKDTEQYRQADMLVSACYCLVQPQLYDNPKTIDEWIEKNIVKFRAFISAAVANTKGDGSKTYLLLGPIGTGAFGNDVNHIGYVFRDVLTSKMMGSSGPISKVFNMSSDEEEFDDDTTDFDEFDTTDEDADDDDDDVNGSTSQPIHFRECLRLLDAALSTSNPPVLPRWCASEQIGPMDDPMLLINGHQRCLSLPLDKREARRFIRKAVPFDMKIDIVDGISVCNFISIEQFNVPIWCLVPVNHKYDLLIDNIPRVLTYLEQNLIPYHNQRNEIFSLINWLLTSSKKIHFNSKLLLHQLLPLLSDNTITYNLIIIIRQLFEHKKFLEQFFPMNNKQDYDDIIYLLNYSKDTKIQLYLHQVFRTVLKRRLRDTDRIHDAIKFIGILSTRNVNSNFIFVLIHELLSNIFKINNPIPSITDLANLLALLSLSIDSFQSSCQIISQQIIQQIKITTITTTNTSTITNLLRTVLVPTLIQIYRQFLNKNQLLRKRKRDSIINFPSWFISLYQTCLSLLNTYCNSNPPIPTYDNLLNIFDIYCCTICQQLFIFLQNTNRFEQTFIISKDKIDHFNMIVNKFNPLIIITKSMTSDKENYQINIIKMSTYDEEISRENNLLRSLLFHIQLSNHFEDQPDTMKKKRFKSSI
ncbi:unnamed protein product [Rotaria sp. Silwood1]|nr:unnamed protein product [Rotaria sp. Silwood1]